MTLTLLKWWFLGITDEEADLFVRAGGTLSVWEWCLLDEDTRFALVEAHDRYRLMRLEELHVALRGDLDDLMLQRTGDDGGVRLRSLLEVMSRA